MPPSPPDSSAPPGVQSGSDAHPELSDSHARRWGWLLVVAGFGGFMAWATLAPLDAGVAAPGTVVVSGNRKAVQPLVGGKIAELAVRDGDAVSAGQILVRLDDTQARSQLDVARGQWFTASAVEARLVAERLGHMQIEFPAALRDTYADPRAGAAMALQGELFATRKRALASELAILEESIRGLEAQLRGVEASSQARRSQIGLLREEIARQRELVEEGFYPRNRLSEQERGLAALNAAIAEDAGNIGRVRQQIAETRSRMIARENQQRQEVESQLTEVQRDAGALASRIEALEFDLRNTEIAAPADGLVVGLAVHTVGGVVGVGNPLMEIVPADEPLKIDAQIPPHLIDHVRAGLEVDILFPAFNRATTPSVAGRVLQVSADVLVEPQHGVQYFKAVIEVTAEGMHKLRQHEIRAGMPAEVFVRTGERTLLNYLLKPLTDRLQGALTEP
jgi:protease secretion system membrane fusion protein